MEGPSLVDMIIELSGLPKEWARNEVRLLAEKKGLPVEALNLDHVREILAELLQEVLLSTKQEVENQSREPITLSQLRL